MSGRRGFTLIEVLIALVVAGFVGALAALTTGRFQVAARARAERSGAVGSLRTVSAVLERELASLGMDSIAGADHQSAGPVSLTFRAHRGLIVVCRIAVDSVVLALGQVPEFRSRLPASGRDSLLLYLPGDSTSTLDAWLPLPLLAGPFGATCPDGTGGSFFQTTLTAAELTSYRITAGGIGRLFESVNARLYPSASGPQFGVEELSAAGVIQPAAGPLRAADGLELAGWDRAGAPSALPLSTAGFDVVVRAASAPDLAVGPGVVRSITDSLLGGIILRNVR
jgi:prepilin-type N-terminal cleavage/methylation domain-containing protein